MNKASNVVPDCHIGFSSVSELDDCAREIASKDPTRRLGPGQRGMILASATCQQTHDSRTPHLYISGSHMQSTVQRKTQAYASNRSGFVQSPRPIGYRSLLSRLSRKLMDTNFNEDFVTVKRWYGNILYGDSVSLSWEGFWRCLPLKRKPRLTTCTTNARIVDGIIAILILWEEGMLFQLWRTSAESSHIY